jgi:4-hydroxyphenylacetate 3-monooxygenase/4-hydroxybutyryl-CoA dehydratase/vinylacetyl-CoA-Delta-isomerase
MISSQQYRDRIIAMRDNVYMDGELVPRDDPRIQGGMNIIAETYDLPQTSEFEDLMTATSHLTGEKINRFCHIHQSADDLLKKQEMTRLSCHKTGGCIQRCMGIDAMNALSVITYEIDQLAGTDYNQRFLKYLEHFQTNDLTANCAQTDVKGDRSKRPHQQADPDLYLRIVERREDGIVVRGAKAHNTVAPYADEIIVIPTRFLTPEEADWAVAFAIPADAEGVKLVCRPASFRPRQQLDAPVAKFGSVESFTIFDDVFVPNERVFMAGEHLFGGPLALLFALYHRHSYTGCKPATSDILMGMAALVSEYNGIEKAKHVQHKASVKSQKMSSGTYIPEVVYANVGRRHAGENIYHEYEMVADLAGGLAATLPLEGDYLSEETGPFIAKYLMRNPKISAEDQYRCFRLISDAISSSMAGLNQIAGIHGGGSPIMESIALLGNYDLNAKKEIVKYLAGITD